MITVPEGVRFYLGDSTHRAAVNLLVTRADVPADLALDELEQFETAALAAQRVRLDFWRLLRQLWQGVWPEAVLSAFPLAVAQTYGEHEAYDIDEAVPSVARAWDQRQTFGIFKLPAGRLVTRVSFVDAGWRQPQLGFYFVDSRGDWALSAGLVLPGWTVEDGWQVAVGSPGNTGVAAQLDPEPMRVLAQNALLALVDALS